MMNKKALLIVATVAALTISVSAHSAWWNFFKKDESAAAVGDVTEIGWEDLIPDDFVQPENPFITMSQEEIDKLMDGSDESNAEIERLQAEFNYAPVVDELDGKRVKIPAYVTPLEYIDQGTIKEFLLVPYLGACIHTPPPPSNQIVHVKSEEAIKLETSYEPIWAIGTIRADSIKTSLAESGYQLEIEKVLPFEPE